MRSLAALLTAQRPMYSGMTLPKTAREAVPPTLPRSGLGQPLQHDADHSPVSGVCSPQSTQGRPCGPAACPRPRRPGKRHGWRCGRRRRGRDIGQPANPYRPTMGVSSDSRTANQTLVGCRSPRSTSPVSGCWQRFGHCQAGSSVGRVAARGSIEASVACSSIRVPSCAPGGEVRAGWSACRLQQWIRAEGRPWRVGAGPRYRPGAVRTAWTIAGSCAARSPLSSGRSRGQWLGSKGVDASKDGGPR